MAKLAGKDLLVQVQIAGEWFSIPGERSGAGTITNEQVDTTTKTDTESSLYRVLSPFGIRSSELTSSGVTADNLDKDILNFLHARAVDGQFFPARLLSSSVVVISDMFQLMTLERNGEHNGAEQYSITLVRADAQPVVLLSFSVYTLPTTVYAQPVTIYGA
jgi:predicted secreted protein